MICRMVSTASRRLVGDLDSQYSFSPDGAVSAVTAMADLSSLGIVVFFIWSVYQEFIAVLNKSVSTFYPIVNLGLYCSASAR